MQSNNAVKLDGQTAGAPVFQRPAGSGGGNKKGTSAERRATHNAIERARRESLNGRFLQLAASLPAISDVRRPSKSLIVNKSLDFVADAMNREAVYRLKIDNMRHENLQLRQQLNEFLAQAGLETLPQPPVDELPVPLAELRNKKRQSMAGGAGSLADTYDLEDDDSLFVAGSEGEGGKNSPTSTSSAASSVRGSLSGSLPTGVAGFTPLSYTGAYTHAPTFLSAPINPTAANSTSPGASSTSEEVGSGQRGAGFVDQAGNWMQRSAFEGQTAAPAQPLTYSGLAFSSSNAHDGLIASSRPDVDGVQSFAALQNGPTPTGLGQGGQAQMYAMDANSLAHLRNAQHLQLQQQHYQFQLQLQQQQQQQQQPQTSNMAGRFFDVAPLQYASFMTAV